MLVSRLTDLIDGCGISVIITGSGDSITNGLPQARILDIGTVHHPTSPHPPVIVLGAGTYIVNGRNQARLTSICACGSPVITGSGDHICTDSSAPAHVFPPQNNDSPVAPDLPDSPELPDSPDLPELPEIEEQYFIVIHDCFCQTSLNIFDEKYEIIKPGTDYSSLPYHFVCERIEKSNPEQSGEQSDQLGIDGSEINQSPSMNNSQEKEYDIFSKPARSITNPCLPIFYPDMIPLVCLMGFHICVVGMFDTMKLKDEHYEKICKDVIIPLMRSFKIPKNLIFLHTEVSTQPQNMKCPGSNFNKQKLLSYIEE